MEVQLDSWPSRCLHSQQTKDSVDLPGAMSHNPALGALKLSAALPWTVSKRNTFDLFIDLEKGNPKKHTERLSRAAVTQSILHWALG